MSKYYTKQAFIDYSKQQIKTNNDLIKAWELIIPIVKSYDGKVINKRLTTAIDKELSKTFKQFYTSIDTFTTYFRLNITVRDNDSYRTSEFSYNYTDYHDSAYCNEIIDYRLDYEKLLKSILKSIDDLEETNKKLDYEVNNIDEIENKFRHIISQIDDFSRNTSLYLHDLYKFH